MLLVWVLGHGRERNTKWSDVGNAAEAEHISFIFLPAPYSFSKAAYSMVFSDSLTWIVLVVPLELHCKHPKLSIPLSDFDHIFLLQSYE